MKAITSRSLIVKINDLKRHYLNKTELTRIRSKSHIKTSALKVSKEQLLDVAKAAANAGASVIMEAVDKPRNIEYKEIGLNNLITETDKNSEEEILSIIKKEFPDHAILGEEGGTIGNTSSGYLWCVDPLDGTTNFAHGYPSFSVSVAVLKNAIILASCVIEFFGGPGHWNTRIYTASRNCGAYADGQPIRISNIKEIEKSLLVTGFGYEHDEAWNANMQLFKHFTDKSQGVRRFGSAAVDLCHVALGITEAYWEYRLKPWDTAGGVLILEEAGGLVTTLDGLPYSVFDRSVLGSNGYIHKEILSKTEEITNELRNVGIDLSPWFVPDGYNVHLGLQLE